MRLKDLLEVEHEPVYAKKINIYFAETLQADERKAKEVAGMLRGLANAINGFESVSGLCNDLFLDDERVTFRFRDEEQAARFKECVDAYFSAEILQNLKAKKVRKRVQR